MKRYHFIVAIFIVATFFSMAHAQAVKDWAQFGRYSEKNDSLNFEPTVVLMGNSITDFWVDKSPEFWKQHPDFVGRGISGQTTSEMLVRFRQDVINLNPKIVVILAGVNDIAQNNGYISHQNILGNVISMIELARAHGIKVALCSILPCAEFPWNKAIKPAPEIIEMNKLYLQYVGNQHDNGLIYVDYYSALANEAGGMKPDFAQDGCHPTPKAYSIMENVLIQALTPWLQLTVK